MSTPTQLGDFLRSRREVLRPSGVSLTRRRTPGLRREEVAARAGIGVDWYIRLEQGRSTSPSRTTVDALARALELTKVEHEHLCTLVKNDVKPPSFTREAVPDSIQRVVSSYPHPAWVTGRRWDILAWNKAAHAVFGYGDVPEEDRNTLLIILTTRAARRWFGAAWENEARRILGQFRAAYDLRADDPAFKELLGRLRAGCPEVARWWKKHDVNVPRSGHKVIFHPKKGALRYAYASFQANDDPALRLVTLVPV